MQGYAWGGQTKGEEKPGGGGGAVSSPLKP